MEPTFFYARGGQQNGPVLMQSLQQMAAAGQLARTDLIWSDGWPQWRAAGDFPEIFMVAPPPIRFPANGAMASAYPAYRPVGASSNGLAVAGFICAFMMPLVGLILCWIALNGMKKSGNFEGQGLAKAGLIISSIIVGLCVLAVLLLATCVGSVIHT